MYLVHNMRPYMTYLPIKIVSPLTTRISVILSAPTRRHPKDIAQTIVVSQWQPFMFKT